MPVPQGYTLDPVPKLPAGYTLDGALPAGATGPLPGQPSLQIPAGLQGPATPPSISDRLTSAAATGADVGTGALKGAGSTANAIGSVVFPNRLATAVGMTPPTPQQQQSYFAPSNTAQKVGKGAEQVGEFLLPGLGEEAATADAGRLTPLAKIGYNALASGAINKAQGGNFTGGAIAGGVGSGIGQGLQRIAPAVAESALNIRKLDRAYKAPQAIGNAILDETTGITPSSVAESAQSKLNALNPQLNASADRASDLANPSASLASTRGVLSRALDTANTQGERTTATQLDPLTTHLTQTISGDPIPENITPRQLLDLKRGFGNEFVNRWNPDTMQGVRGTAAQAYHEMAQELNNTVPEAQGLNSRISNLIPIAKRADSIGLNAPSTQMMLHRLAVPTGAMAAPLGMGAYGYEKGGVGGAAKGFAEGMAIPLLAASPTGQMALARGLNSPVLRRLMIPAAVGGGLQFNRSGQNNPNQ